MGRSKMRRRAQQHNVALLDHVLVRVEPGEAAFGRNVDAVSRRPVLKAVVRRFDAIGKSVTQRDEVDAGVRRQCLLGRSRASPTASD
jgi:hypothetical protein